VASETLAGFAIVSNRDPFEIIFERVIATSEEVNNMGHIGHAQELLQCQAGELVALAKVGGIAPK
jgi:hypothetical protein